jgi:hypothetical protein
VPSEPVPEGVSRFHYGDIPKRPQGGAAAVFIPDLKPVFTACLTFSPILGASTGDLRP